MTWRAARGHQSSSAYEVRATEQGRTSRLRGTLSCLQYPATRTSAWPSARVIVQVDKCTAQNSPSCATGVCAALARALAG